MLILNNYILECASLIRDYTANGQVEFTESTLIQGAVLLRL